MKHISLFAAIFLFSTSVFCQTSSKGSFQTIIIDGDTNYARNQIVDGDTVLFYYAYKKKRLQASESEVFKFIEYMPFAQYDVDAHIENWFKKHLKGVDIKGEVAINFLVNKDGRLSHFKLTGKSLHPIADKQVLQAVKTLPKWKAGMHNGRLVGVFYTLRFKYN